MIGVRGEGPFDCAQGRARATLTCPESFLVVLADDIELRGGRLGRFADLLAEPEVPSGVAQHVFNFHAGMKGCQIGLAVFVEPEYSFRRDHGCWPASREANALPPSCAVTIPGTG